MITATRTTHTLIHKGKTITYEVWPCNNRVGWFYWEALGNGGIEPSQELARATARRWIRTRQ